MLTEDYIMRMISQALAVLMTALGLKRAGKSREALQAFDEAAENLLGLNARLANQLDEETLLDRLTFMGKIDLDRAQVLADIYREQAEVYQTLGDSENSQLALHHSLRLYLEVILANPVSQDNELIQKIEGLRSRLSLPNLPIETRLALVDYLERMLALNDSFLATHGLSRPDLENTFTSLESLL